MNKRWTLGYLVLGGPIAWFVHLMILYFIGEGLCLLQWPTFSTMGLSGPRVFILLVSVILIAMVGLAIRLGSRMKQSLSERATNQAECSTLFLARFSLVSNGIFLLVIVVETIPVFAWMGTC